MTALQLTEEHKAKLLEMCKVLFPQYRAWNIKPKIPLPILQCVDENLKIIRIHWFEFCFTEISPKIALLAAKTDLLMEEEFIQFQTKFHYETMLHRIIHPVDYLYTEFKKLQS